MSATLGIGLGILLATTWYSMPHAAKLVVHQRPGAFADVALRHSARRECGAACQAVNCGCIGVWQVCPQKLGDSIECSEP